MSFSDDDPNKTREPILNLPPGTTALILGIALIFVLTELLSDEWRHILLLNLGFVPARYTAGESSWQLITSPISHVFLHGSITHIFVNTAMLAAFGSGVERALGSRKLFTVFFLSAIAGTLLHFIFFSSSLSPVIGASGGISGLFGTVLRLMYRPSTKNSAQIWIAAAAWIIISVIAGFINIFPGTDAITIAWAAHVGGFISGIILPSLIRLRDE